MTPTTAVILLSAGGAALGAVALVLASLALSRATMAADALVDLLQEMAAPGASGRGSEELEDTMRTLND